MSRRKKWKESHNSAAASEIKQKQDKSAVLSESEKGQNAPSSKREEKRKKYHKSLKEQAYEHLSDMMAIGQSKKEAIANGTEKEKIFTGSTYETYWKHIKYYFDWLKKTHPEVTSWKKSKKYVSEWLQSRTDQGLSAWTISLETSALCKLFQIDTNDPKRFTPPKRRRQDIKRSRVRAKRDKYFSETNNAELINFCRGTGCRRGVLQRLKGDDYWTRDRMEKKLAELKSKAPSSFTPDDRRTISIIEDALSVFPDQTDFIYHKKDKGGRYRFAPIIGPDKDAIIKRMKDTSPDEKVWQVVHSGADVHGYRADYATRLYKKYARKIEDIPYDTINRGTGKKYQSGVYYCRKDEKGRKLDRQSMYKCSKALGHNRVNVVAQNYLRGL